MSASMLQYINCFGGVFRPVNFVSKIESEKSQNKGSMVGPVLIFGLLFLLAAVVSVWSYLSLIIATDERDQMQQRYNALSSVQSEYNELMQTENNYGVYHQVQRAIDLNNNHFRSVIEQIEAVCPTSFNISTINSDGFSVQASCVSSERLSSLSALIIQLNKIDDIKNVWLDSISEDESGGLKKTKYNYTMTFEYAPKPPLDETAGNTEGGEQ